MGSSPQWLRRAREGWKYRGSVRPQFAVTPSENQESVWDYPRPPQLELDDRQIEVKVGQVLIASTTNAYRVLETAHPPTFYLPTSDVEQQHLQPAAGSSFCEWKGRATFWSVAAPGSPALDRVAWSYVDPFPEFMPISGYFSFYPARLECYVAGTRVIPQPGGFYGGWVTPELVGPFKGDPGSESW